MHIQFPHPAALDFRDVVMAMVPFVRNGGVTIVANRASVFVTALTENVDLKFRIPSADTLRAGNTTVSIFDLRGILKERVIRTTKKSPLSVVRVENGQVVLSIAGRLWRLDQKTE